MSPQFICTDARLRPRVSKTLGVSRVQVGADGAKDHGIQ